MPNDGGLTRSAGSGAAHAGALERRGAQRWPRDPAAFRNCVRADALRRVPTAETRPIWSDAGGSPCGVACV